MLCDIVHHFACVCTSDLYAGAFPGTFQPTPGHYFIKLLHDKGLLQRCFTQNIDSLEHQADLPKQEIVAAHGNFDSEFWLMHGAKRPCNVMPAHQGFIPYMFTDKSPL